MILLRVDATYLQCVVPVPCFVTIVVARPSIIRLHMRNGSTWVGAVGTLAGGSPWPHCCATVVDNTPIVLQGGGWAGLGWAGRCLDKHANKHISFQLGIFHAAEHSTDGHSGHCHQPGAGAGWLNANHGTWNLASLRCIGQYP